MKILRQIAAEIGTFVMKLVMINLMVILAPVLCIAVPVAVLIYGTTDQINVVKVAYLFLGPICAGFWFLYFQALPAFRAAKKSGVRLETWSFAYHFLAISKMGFGTIVSYAAAFFVAAPSSHLAFGSSNAVWFAEMFLAVGSPIFLMWGYRRFKGTFSISTACMFCDGKVKHNVCGGCQLDYSVVA